LTMENRKNEVRLQKYIADAGICSRRKAEELIRDGHVKVNGQLIREMGVKVINSDKVYVRGKPVNKQGKKIYILLNKPRGYLSTSSDDKDRKTVLDLVKSPERIYPVGRLDYNTTGAILLTNDGDFANKLTHPKNKIEKTYIATVKGIPDTRVIDKLQKGLVIDGKKTAPASVKILNTANGKTDLEVILKEGRNRQIRKMFESVGFLIHKLQRIKIGNISLTGLPSGKWRDLNEKEIKRLLE
jgi:23S rRNA pseudouridine2605 synthase